MRKVGSDEGPGAGLLNLRGPRPDHVDHEAGHEAGAEAGHVTRVQDGGGTRVRVRQLTNLIFNCLNVYVIKYETY